MSEEEFEAWLENLNHSMREWFRSGEEIMISALLPEGVVLMTTKPPENKGEVN